MLSPKLKEKLSPALDAGINFEELLRKIDTEFPNLPSTMLERFCFSFDGIVFDIRHIVTREGHRFVFNATIGYLPFSIESKARREAIKAILMATRSLTSVHFSVDSASRIAAGAFYDVDKIVPPDVIFHPLISFLQEARPFMNLIGKYLFEPMPEVSPEETAKIQAYGKTFKS